MSSQLTLDGNSKRTKDLRIRSDERTTHGQELFFTRRERVAPDLAIQSELSVPVDQTDTLQSCMELYIRHSSFRIDVAPQRPALPENA